MNLRPVPAGDQELEYDFRGVWWGMSKHDVISSEGIEPNTENDSYVTFSDEFLEMDTVVAFRFVDDVLMEAGYAFREQLHDEDHYVHEYEKIKTWISETHGEPMIDENLNPPGADRVDKDQNTGSVNNLMFLTEWFTERSIIRLILMGDSSRCEFGLLLKSKEHIEEIEINDKEIRQDYN